jgi:2Fe-2S ferredoxin
VATIVFRHRNGVDQPVDASDGLTVMDVAMMAGVDGILGECGGNVTCSTCHVYVEDGQDVGELAAMSEDEDDLLDSTASERKPTSRLSCQIVVAAELDGLVVELPASQV